MMSCNGKYYYFYIIFIITFVSQESYILLYIREYGKGEMPVPRGGRVAVDPSGPSTLLKVQGQPSTHTWFPSHLIQASTATTCTLCSSPTCCRWQLPGR